MCDAGMIVEYGLVGAFDTVAMLCGEEVAIINNPYEETEPEYDESVGDHIYISLLCRYYPTEINATFISYYIRIGHYK